MKVQGGPTEVKSFSVRKFGDAAAFDMAVRARAAMLEVAESGPYVHDPVAKRFARRTRSGKAAGSAPT